MGPTEPDMTPEHNDSARLGQTHLLPVTPSHVQTVPIGVANGLCGANVAPMETLHVKYSSNLWDRLTDGGTTHHTRKRSIGSIGPKRALPALPRGFGLPALIQSAQPT